MAQARGAEAGGIPHLETRGKATQLVVDGRPFLILGGEVHNSNSSSVEYMQPIWPRLEAMHLNTVLVPVAWGTIKPAEGKFDFRCLDGLLDGARRNHLHLVVLWFGAWKNTFSSYAPGWVKTDLERFPRVQLADGRDTERLSPFSATVRDADARAFAALLHHLREVDGEKHTVLMVQVENEVGVIPQSRDHSEIANKAFAAPVPAELIGYMRSHRGTLEPELRSAWESAGEKTQGSWQEVFGKTPLTDDLFMAWQYASFIEHIAAAGKTEYPLPMYANAALIRPNYEPGQYNSGGPLPQSLDLWHVAAPSLNFLSPDIYFNEFSYWAGRYSRPGNPLFIPEAQGGETGAANSLYAFGRLNAMGFSPFGIDDVNNTPVDLVGITNAPQHAGSAGALSGIYGTLAALAPTVLEKQASGGITAEMIKGDAQRAARVAIGNYTATFISTSHTAGARVGAMFLQMSPEEFLVIGAGEGQIMFSTDKPGPGIVGIESIDEEFFENGAWMPRRRLNGDENGQGQVLKLSASDAREGRIYRVRLYRYR
ncbi:MAG TPA: DUF5597 domain-containing protein [Bryocella sp.]|nr:DUF5597 domain-containing protein [Bryocella sp.]